MWPDCELLVPSFPSPIKTRWTIYIFWRFIAPLYGNVGDGLFLRYHHYIDELCFYWCYLHPSLSLYTIDIYRYPPVANSANWTSTIYFDDFHNCKLSFLGIRRQPRLITTTDLFQIWLWVKIYWYHSGNGDHFSPTMLVDNAGSLEFWWVLTTLRHRGSCKGYQPGGKCRGAAMFFHGGSPGVGDDFFIPVGWWGFKPWDILGWSLVVPYIERRNFARHLSKNWLKLFGHHLPDDHIWSLCPSCYISIERIHWLLGPDTFWFGDFLRALKHSILWLRKPWLDLYINCLEGPHSELGVHA